MFPSLGIQSARPRKDGAEAERTVISKNSLILRHSFRAEPDETRSLADLRLTERGRDAAFQLGVELAEQLGDKRFRVFCSTSEYCKETAELLARGARTCAGSTTIREQKFLGSGFIVDGEAMMAAISKLGTSNFARMWLSGHLDSRIIEDPLKSVSETFNGILSTHCADSNAVDIFVTHVWNILCLKDILLGLRHEEIGWPEHLDTVFLGSEDERVTMTWRGVSKSFFWKLGWNLALKGLPVSPGITSGKVKRVLSSMAANQVRTGHVWAVSETSPQYLPGMFGARAIVTDRGGLLSHPAIVARELGVPGVVGTVKATEVLHDDEEVVVDGYDGFVFRR